MLKYVASTDESLTHKAQRDIHAGDLDLPALPANLAACSAGRGSVGLGMPTSEWCLDLNQQPDFGRRVRPIADDLVAVRRDIHRHPELGMQERRTSALIARQLADLGIRVKMGHDGVGVIGELKGRDCAPVVCLRADMDALPVTEDTGLPWESQVPGVMHACGHDIHCAALLGAAQLVAEVHDELRGTVRFLFEPAEETDLGARAMIQLGALEEPTPIAVFGMHIWPDLDCGEVGIQAGPVMAAIDSLDFTITGVQSHGAVPQAGCDALMAAALSVTALQQIVSRNVDPLQSAVITVGQMQSGTARNIVAETARLSGTVRTLDREVRHLVRRRVQETIDHCAEACGASATVEYTDELPVLDNSPRLCEIAVEAANGLFGAGSVRRTLPSMAGDDFALYAERVPGCYMFLGGTPAGQPRVPLHNPRFCPDEGAVFAGAALLAAVCWNMLR